MLVRARVENDLLSRTNVSSSAVENNFKTKNLLGNPLMQLLQHFKELTLRPKNAQELKGLILQLAIQGKLTAHWREQNLDIEPAVELLEKSKQEKARLMEDKIIRKEKALTPITKDDIPYELPERWVWSKLGDLIAMYNGRAFKTSEWSETGLPIIRIQNLNKKSAPFNYFNGEVEDRHLIKKGTFLISWSGTPGTSFGAFIWNGFDGALNQHINKCEFYSSEIFDEFIKRSINSQLYKLIDQAQGGAGLKHVTKGILNNLLLPLPPQEEQKEIVKVVETLFKGVEQLEQLTVARIGLKEDYVTSALQRLTANSTNKEWTNLQDHFKSFFNETTNIKKLRETILQLAVQGKLTADWRVQNPNTEDTSLLLKRIQEEKAQLIADKKIKKEKALPAITEEEIPYELPEGWVWCRLNDVCEYIQRGKSPKYTETPKIPVISQKCVQWSGFDITRARFITEESLEKYVEARFLQKGDLLWNSTGDGTIGRVISYPGSVYEKVVADSHVTVVRGSKKFINSDYLWIFTASPLIQNLVAGRVSGSTKQTELGTGTVKSMEFSLPPLEEQKAIVKKVNTLMALCDALEQEVQQSQQHSEMMMQSVLKEVFEGDKMAI